MTLTEIINQSFLPKLDKQNTEALKKIIKVIATEYAREIIPGEDKSCVFCEEDEDMRYGFEACRTQILSRIEEDSK